MAKIYPIEFKMQIIDLLLHGHSSAELGRRYRIGKNTANDWFKTYGLEKVPPEEVTNDTAKIVVQEHVEIKQLKKDLKIVQDELTLLKRLALTVIQQQEKIKSK